MSKTTTVSNDIRDLLYVGGPLDGKYMQYDRTIKPWPPKVKTCISDIKVGALIGMYFLRGSTLEYKLTKPHTIKSSMG